MSDVLKGCKKIIQDGQAELNLCMTVVDICKYQVYMKNFAEFYEDQIKNAKTIIFSKTQQMKEDEIEQIVEDIRQYNSEAAVIANSWTEISGTNILEIAEKVEEIKQLELLFQESDELINYYYKTHFDRKIHHGHELYRFKHKMHHADEVFQVWGKETEQTFEKDEISKILNSFDTMEGNILRAKGIVSIQDGTWIQFDYVPKEMTIKETVPDQIGRICIIGEQIDEKRLSDLFQL